MEDSSAGEDTKTCPRGHWRPAEDEKLRQLVEQYGAQNWNSIAEKLQGRSGIGEIWYIINYKLDHKFLLIKNSSWIVDDLIQGFN